MVFLGAKSQRGLQKVVKEKKGFLKQFAKCPVLICRSLGFHWVSSNSSMLQAMVGPKCGPTKYTWPTILPCV
jgi:hypothetical protein